MLIFKLSFKVNNDHLFLLKSNFIESNISFLIAKRMTRSFSLVRIWAIMPIKRNYFLFYFHALYSQRYFMLMEVNHIEIDFRLDFLAQYLFCWNQLNF